MPHANSSDFLTSLFSLRDKVAVVIGGTGELCGAMAEGLARAGAEAVIVGRNQDKASARIARIDAAGGRAWFHAAEATSKAEIETLLDAVLQPFRPRRHRRQRRRHQLAPRRFSTSPKMNSIASFA